MKKLIKATEAYLITDRSNIRYLSNFSGSSGFMLLTKNKSYLFTDARYERDAKKQITQKTELNILKSSNIKLLELLNKLKIKTLHFESQNLTVDQHKKLNKNLKKIKLKPSTDFIEQFRIQKTENEIQLITKSQRINEKTLKEVINYLKVGVSEKQIEWKIKEIGNKFGAEDISFTPIVGFGSNSGSPHHLNSNRKLKKGDMILIDMGMKYKGYCSDMTRTFFTKKPTTKQEKVYNIVLEAQEETIKNIKSGMTGLQIDKIARDVISKNNFGDEFSHSTGHGIGLQVHESPTLSIRYSKSILNNTVVTVEPGIYLKNSFGIRIEDMVLVKGKKAKSLTRFPKKIKNLILSIS